MNVSTITYTAACPGCGTARPWVQTFTADYARTPDGSGWLNDNAYTINCQACR